MFVSSLDVSVEEVSSSSIPDSDGSGVSGGSVGDELCFSVGAWSSSGDGSELF